METAIPNVVGMPLSEAIKQLTASHIPFSVAVTKPRTKKFSIDLNLCYVVRQISSGEGIDLVVAGKMVGGRFDRPLE